MFPNNVQLLLQLALAIELGNVQFVLEHMPLLHALFRLACVGRDFHLGHLDCVLCASVRSGGEMVRMRAMPCMRGWGNGIM